MAVKISSYFKSYKRPSDHSTFSPSSADRWLNCPFSINGSKGIPEEPPSIYAAMGTEAHTVCEDYANYYFFFAEKTKALKEASDENLQSAKGWVHVIKSWLNRPNEIGDIIYFGLETGLPIFPERGCFGTADAVIIGTKGAAVLDFKNGTGRSVGPRSAQLRVYLLSVLHYVEGIPDDYNFNAIIYQPRLDDVPKEADYTRAELEEFSKEVSDKIDQALKGRNEPCLGSHCFWCPASRTNDVNKKCPAKKQEVIDLASSKFDDYLATLNEPTGNDSELNKRRDQAIIKLMNLFPVIEKTVKDAMVEFLLRLEKGEKIKGVDLVEKYGNRKWAENPQAVADRLSELYSIDPWVELKPRIKTITEVEKEVGKNRMCGSLTARPVSKEIVLCEKSVSEILSEFEKYTNVSNDWAG